ncbi:MAG: UDP-N-acetylmuramoyl-L-alanyl-D-glutamate--2,6-diaminopimelate ligase [Candidatus Cloacimonetes bacterium]|nr:UDP-N-acetylmuramoyl-L-alanyl-D-glutamate--2,6-diaminopimelate ligase [Candidatus Cloacimonadota bacterium]
MITRIIAILKEHSLLLEGFNYECLPGQFCHSGLDSESTILDSCSRPKDNIAIPINKIQTDHRLVSKGDIFVCIKGEHFDGHSVIPQALASGAAFIVACSASHPNCQTLLADNPEQLIMVTDTRKAAALIARKLWLCNLPKNTEKPFTLIGITGTNGKTTTSLIIYEALRKLGFKCGWIGTLGYYIDGTKYPTAHTTPDIIQLNEVFAQMANEGVSYVVMEVSSHALSLDRVYGVQFDYCLFSNLSRDHLDFHGDMESYAEAKYTLFKHNMALGATAIINMDDPFGAVIYGRLQDAGIKSFSIGMEQADFCITEIITDIRQSSFKLISRIDDTILDIHSQLIGRFNIQNLGLTSLTLHSMGFPAADIQEAMLAAPPVKGRIEKVDNPFGIGIFVDYAHTPDAIENLLKSVETLPHKRILCLFGAGGDRDKGKRPLMLKAALNHSDAVIVTDDNPRGEAPEAIISEILVNSDLRLPWWVIRDRSLAIKSLIRLAQEGDLVLICGKGHESYQEIEGVRHPFDDKEQALEALTERHKELPPKDDDELILPLDSCMLKLMFAPEKLVLKGGYLPPKSYKYISSDSRTVKPESLFIAIKGDSFDGHSFLGSVLADSKNCAIAQTGVESNNKQIFLVPDSVEGMGSICAKYLQMFNAKRIALTGSTGKTSTKELINRILEDEASCLKTAKNENNKIGVCKTILRIEPKHKYAIFEIGSNHFGEIDEMAEIITPEVGIIVNIGPSHLEFFGDEDGVFAEKSDLFKRPLALRLYPGDDPRFIGYAADDTAIGIGLGERCIYQIVNHKINQDSQSFSLKRNLPLLHNLPDTGLQLSNWHLPYSAPHYAVNATFAIVLALKLGIAEHQIQASLSQPVLLEMRAQNEPRGSGLLIIDCYNANPFSMQKALEYWELMEPSKPHFAILGDMLELGDKSAMYHQMVGAMLAEKDYSGLFTIGTMAKNYCLTKSEKHHCYTDTEHLISDNMIKDIPQDAVILLKASHGMHLERLIPILRGEN